MELRQRRQLPTEWRTTDCPACGGTLKFAERVYSFRSLRGWDGPTLQIDRDPEDSDEDSDDNHLFCRGCLVEWTLPNSVSFDGVT